MRELARGIHPAALEHGIASALEAVAARSTVPTVVTCDVTERLPQQVELGMYFVACEALTNVAKYAQATAAAVSVARTDRGVVIEIADDGVGGADASGGSGLRGLADRVEALGGHLLVTSPARRGNGRYRGPARVRSAWRDGDAEDAGGLVAVASGQPTSHGPTISAAALMGTREAYAPGVFCWVDLATSDVDGAKAFYENLFGWDYDDRDAGDGQTYTMASRDGHVVAGMMAAADPGPPRWQSYIAVASADDAASKAASAGAQVLMAPVDVGPAGRAALLEDPSGAAVFIWEARERVGAALVNAPGALCWNDLLTRDVTKAAAFYETVFGWDLAPVEGAPGNRHSIRVGTTLNGGIAEVMTPEMPSHWLACFAVDDVPAARAAAEAAGGRSLTDVFELPSGRFAVVTDPQNAAFGIIDGDMDP